jgi:hypothetical protein
MILFPGLGYLRVWDKLTAALTPLGAPRPSEKALRDLRRRIGPAPVKALFETIAVPLAQPRTPGVAYRGLRTVAFDGLNSVKVPDSDRNRCWLGKFRSRLGLAGYPALRIVVLAETGTRGLLGAAIGARGDRNEAPLARRLVPLLARGMLVLADRAYDSGGLLSAIAGRRDVPDPRHRHPQAAGAPAAGRRLVPVGPGRAAGPDHRGGPGGHRDRRQQDRGPLPADHHAAGSPPVPGRHGGPTLP